MKRNKFSWSQALLHTIFILVSIFILIPFLILISSSLTADDYLKSNGYQLLPIAFSTQAYQYLIQNWQDILRSYSITIGVTICGTMASLVVVCLMAYPLSLSDFPGKKIITFMLVFAMLFNGGLVPTYIMYTQYFDMKDSLLSLIIPSLFMSSFNVLLVRNYYVSSIPRELMDAARIDGASDLRILFTIVLPLSKPIIATVGIMQGLAYWNDWFNSMLYITDDNLLSIQAYLNQIQRNIQFLAHSDLANVFGDLIVEMPEVSVRMAIAVIAVLPVLCAYPFIQKLFVKGIAAGAVKG